MSAKDYILIARPGHWFKNIFVLPGTACAAILIHKLPEDFLLHFILGLVSTCLITSSNYVINEWLDANYDRFHPTKKNRPAVVKGLKFRYVFLEYIVLVMVSLTLAIMISKSFFVIAVFFLIMGAIYNLRPFRTKEIVYLDVLSESINNPIRLLLGWFMVAECPLPPSSLLIGYWMGGAFLMGIKRYAEYRFINNPVIASSYRTSFKYYNEENLLISSFFYAICAAFFLGIFLIKYRIELIFSFPFFAILFAWYLKIGMQNNSPAQNPEKLFTQKYFVLYVIFLIVIVGLLIFVNIPILQWFLNNAFLSSMI